MPGLVWSFNVVRVEARVVIDCRPRRSYATPAVGFAFVGRTWPVRMDGVGKFVLYSMEEESSEPEYFGPITLYRSSADRSITLDEVRGILEEKDVFDWDFDFWDRSSRKRMKRKSERVYEVEKTGASITVIRSAKVQRNRGEYCERGAQPTVGSLNRVETSMQPTDIGCSFPQLCSSVYLLHQPEGPPDIEVVFIHGLQFNDVKEAYWKTWLVRDTENECWPATWLKSKVPKARVLSLSYDAAAKVTATTGRMDLYLLGESLLPELCIARVGQHNCPVVFVGHDLGGLVAKQIAIFAHRESKSDEQAHLLLRNLGGFFFYGTPHAGTRWADDAASHHYDGPLLSYLKTLNDDSGRLDHDFQHARDCHASQWECRIVAESHETCVGKDSMKLVEESSARLSGFRLLHVGADHFDICKPVDRTDSCFQSLEVFLLDILKSHEVEPLRMGAFYVASKNEENLLRKMAEGEVVGVVGMGGIGKTTLCKSVYNSQRRFYDKCCYIEVFGQSGSNSKSVEDVQRELYGCLCGGDLSRGGDVGSEHLRRIRECIKSRKVLVVYDDVWSDSTKCEQLQIEAFTGGGSGSRAVLASRNWQSLVPFTTIRMKMEVLDDDQAMKLFRFHVFEKPQQRARERGSSCDEPLEKCIGELEEVSKGIVKACGGLPLSLEVMGGYLGCQGTTLSDGERLQIWDEAMKKLLLAEKIQGGSDNDRLWSVLRISIDCLEDREKTLYLDIACSSITTNMNRSGSRAINHVTSEEVVMEEDIKSMYCLGLTTLQNLVDRCLVKRADQEINPFHSSRFSDIKKTIGMHDQLRALGRKMGGLSHGDDISLAQRLRLTDMKMFHQVMQQGKVFDNLECILLPKGIYGVARIERRAKGAQLCTFPKLRIFIALGSANDVLYTMEEQLPALEILVLDSWHTERPVILPDESFFSSKLRYLRIHGCTKLGELLHSLNNSATRLEELTLFSYIGENSNCSDELEQASVENLKCLKRVAMFNFHQLKALPKGLGHLPRLESVRVNGCGSLRQICEFGGTGMLQSLQIDKCRSRKTLPTSRRNLYLQHLEIWECGIGGSDVVRAIGELCLHLETLELSGDLKDCPNVNFPRLKAIRLETLPAFIQQLSGLESLKLEVWPLSKFPESLTCLPKLQVINVFSCMRVEELSASIGHLSRLTFLRLGFCHSLRGVSDEIGGLSQLQHLKLEGGAELTELPSSLGNLSQLKSLVITHAKLRYLPESLSKLSRLRFLSLKGCYNLQYLHPTHGSDLKKDRKKIQVSMLEDMRKRGCIIKCPHYACQRGLCLKFQGFS